MLLLDEVTRLRPARRPVGARLPARRRPRSRRTTGSSPGHFKNDPCMPGTLMFEGCLQAMAFYLAALGYTLERDGWRFEPVPEQHLRAALPRPGRCPTIARARLRGLRRGDRRRARCPRSTPISSAPSTGCKAFHAGAWACAWCPTGRSTRSGLPRLPTSRTCSDSARASASRSTGSASTTTRCSPAPGAAPPRRSGRCTAASTARAASRACPARPTTSCRASRASTAPIGGMKAGPRSRSSTTCPPTPGTSTRTARATMPFAVLLEAALQPCGWLASYVGSALTSDDGSLFRNLDGTGTVRARGTARRGTLATT